MIGSLVSCAPLRGLRLANSTVSPGAPGASVSRPLCGPVVGPDITVEIPQQNRRSNSGRATAHGPNLGVAQRLFNNRANCVGKDIIHLLLFKTAYVFEDDHGLPANQNAKR